MRSRHEPESEAFVIMSSESTRYYKRTVRCTGRLYQCVLPTIAVAVGEELSAFKLGIGRVPVWRRYYD